MFSRILFYEIDGTAVLEDGIRETRGEESYGTL